MKKLLFIFAGLFLLCFSNISINKVVAQEKPTNNTISIVTTPDLYRITNNWTNEFCKLNPEMNIKVIKFTDAGLPNILNTGADLCILSTENYSILNNNKLWKMEVGKDALIPIINSKNPFLSELKKQNISPEILAQILKNPENRVWNVFPKTGKSIPVNYYMLNNQADKSMIAKFLSSGKTIEGISVESNEKLISAIQNDPYAIGFCKLSNLINSNNQNIDKNITIMPVDKNENGKIDDFENVYCDLTTLMRKVWIGEFPTELTGSIYSIATQTPVNQNEIAFLKWISTDGQQFLNEYGYSTLVSAEKQSNLAMLGFTKDYVVASSDSSLFSKIAGFFASISLSLYVFTSFILLLIATGIIMTIASKKNAIEDITENSTGVFDENSLVVPTGLFFDKTHTWAFMEKDGNVRIGIDDFLQHITGSLTKLKMKRPGEMVKKGEPIFSIMKDGKQLNINSPVSGKIVAQNEKLTKEPSIMNQSPYTNGWVYMIQPTNWVREIQFFVMADKYNEWIKYEFSRLKDFLAITLHAKMPEYALVVMQDGGVIQDNVLADLGPEVWEEFQTNFIDTMK